MDEKYVDEYYEFLIRNEERLKNDEKMVRETLASHLSHVPEKLYKYRTCTMQNFRTLKEGNIYMPRADAFKDPFDYTLNFDLSKNVDKMHAFFLKHIDQLVYSGIKGILQQNGIIVPDFSIEDVRHIRENYFLEDGTRLTEKFEQDIMSKGTDVDNVLYRKSQDLVEYYLKDGSSQLIGLCERLAEDVNRASREPRDTTLVYCMTEDKSCGPMWENYADGYTGFCIEYDFSDWENKQFEDVKNLIYIFPVIYLKERPVFDVIPFFETSIRSSVFGEAIDKDIPLQVELNKQLLRKEAKYSYEQEWRFAIKNRQNNIQPFPFVSAIYMGKDITENNIKHLKVVARKLKVPLYKQTLNYFGNEFRYEKVEV